MNVGMIAKKIQVCASLVLEPFIEYFTSSSKRRSIRYARFYKRKIVKKELIVYLISGESKQSDSVVTLFRELSCRPQYRNYRHVVLKGAGVSLPMSSDSDATVVSSDSRKYLKMLSSARVLISDTDMPDFFVKKPEQVLIQVCQKSGEKTGESSSFAKVLSISSRERNLLYADYVFSPDDVVKEFDQKINKQNGYIQAPAHSKCEKKKILFSRGSMLVNGISTALINLLKQFDYEKYDVTVVVAAPENEGEREQIKRLSANERIRLIIRPDDMPVTLIESVKDGIFNQAFPETAVSRWAYSPALYMREFRRLFGDFKFDYIIDYDGYNIFYALLCLVQNDAKTYIWLHNDMLSEYKMKYRWLKLIFSAYSRFDYLVSCSQQIMEKNRSSFSSYLPKDKFRYAKNCVDFERVMKGSQQGQIVCSDGYYYGLPDSETDGKNIHWLPLQPGQLKEWEKPDIQIGGERVENGVTRFVNIGRLSVEKNQAVLIRAFARLVDRHKHVMLYIMGDGPERENLAELISRLDLQKNVFLTGNVSNPFGLLHQCHCFVLPSLHEGQPLVIFEARALQMPIIVSRFSSVGGSVMENGQYLIDMDEESVYQGLEAYMAGEVPLDYQFEAEKYNREAYGEFETAVFAVPTESDTKF